MRFTKMQSVGNDYVVLDAFQSNNLPPTPAIAEHAPAICDRHCGIGADGIVLLRPTDSAAHADMTIINADGSDGTMCGNGLRCAAKLLVDRAHARPDTHNRVIIRIAGRLVTANVHLDHRARVEAATVDMGPPTLDTARIPLDTAALAPPNPDRPHVYSLDSTDFVPVAVGNPHAVVFTGMPDKLLFRLGPAWETHPAFPDRTNVQLLNVISQDEAVLLSWERGVGHTLGCGTGACAAAVAAHLTGRLSRNPVIRMPGGEVVIRWDEASNHVFMTGPAAEVFRGDWPAPWPEP